MNDRVAILGASGQLGTALRAEYADVAVCAPSHAELDFSDTPALEAFLERERVGTLINCTAFHNVDECERQPERAFDLNTLAVDRAARAAKNAGAVFATISTDYVFDGRAGHAYAETDATNPLSAYGVSKLAGEQLVARHGSEHFIFRTSGVYNASGKTSKGYVFVERVLQQAERGEPVRVVDNMTFSPSFAPHVAHTMRAAIEARAYGTHHVTNAGATTWFEFARTTFAPAGLQPDLQPLRYDQYESVVKRPLYSALRSVTLPAAGIALAPAWETGLREYIALRAKRLASVPR